MKFRKCLGWGIWFGLIRKRKNYTSTRSAPTIYHIPEEAYSIRIYNLIDKIVFPVGNSNIGRVFILMNWSGNSDKELIFSETDNLRDPTTNLVVNSITGGQRLMVQSTGSHNWITIGN